MMFLPEASKLGIVRVRAMFGPDVATDLVQGKQLALAGNLDQVLKVPWIIIVPKHLRPNHPHHPPHGCQTGSLFWAYQVGIRYV